MEAVLDRKRTRRRQTASTQVSREASKPVAAAQEASPALRWLIVTAAMIGAVLEVLDTSITNVAVPQMMGNLGATLSEIGWVSTGYIVSNVIILPMTGWLQERFGRRAYFTTSIIVFTIASLMCGFSHSLTSLIFWRVVQGLGGGGLLSTGQVIMLQAFPKSQQGVATAIFGMGVMVGPSLGPVLGGWLTDNLSWPWIFFINLPFGIVGAVLALSFVPKTMPVSQPRPKAKMTVDIPGILLLAIGMGAMQTVLERGQEDDWFSSGLIVFLTVVAVVGLVSFVLWELWVPNPIVNLRVLKNRSLAAGSVFGAVLGIGLYATLFLLPVYLQNSQGYTAYQTGMILMPSALVSMVSFMIAGPLTQKYDARIILAIGAVLMGFGTYGLSSLTTLSGGSDIFWPLVLRGMSLGFLFIPLTVASLAGLKSEEIGVGSGMINLTRQLGGSIGIAGFSTALTQRQEFHMQSVSAHLTASSPSVQNWLAGAQVNLMTHGDSAVAASAGALQLLAITARKQAMMLSFNDSFIAIAAAFFFALPLVFIFQKGDGSNVDTSGAH